MPTPSQDSSIAANLRDDILRGRYRCGERLPSERDLAQRFGVHRSTVREAFKRLEQLGVACIHPGGARVAPLDEASLDVVEHLLALQDPPEPEILDQTLEAVSGFRAMAARLGTERADESQRAKMLKILAAMMADDLDGSDRFELVAQLGDCFVEACGNRVLRLMSHTLLKRSAISSRDLQFLNMPELRSEFEPHLLRLTSAIESSDGANASESVYMLSMLFRRAIRENATEVGIPRPVAVGEGGRS